MPESEKIFNKVLKEYRVLKGMSQAEMAKRIGIDRTVLSFLETGRQQPTTKHLILLKDKLGIDFSDTVFGEADRPYYGPPREHETNTAAFFELYNLHKEIKRDLLRISDMMKEHKDEIRELPGTIRQVLLAVESLVNQTCRKI